VISVILQTWWSVEQDRKFVDEADEKASQATINLLEEHATQTIRDAERNLDIVINELDYQSKSQTIDDVVLRKTITRAQPFNRVLKALQFVNTKGEVFVGAIDYPAYQTDADDRSYINDMLRHPERRGLVIGKPFQRFYDLEQVIPIAKNVYDHNDRYLGLISTDISVSYFSEVHTNVVAGTQAIVAMLSTDGTVLTRAPVIESLIGANVSSSAFFLSHLLNQSLNQAELHYNDHQFLSDNQPAMRRYYARRIKGYPLMLIYAKNIDEIRETWQQRRRDRFAYAAILIVLLFALIFVLKRSIDKLTVSERSLRQSESSLRLSESKFSLMFNQSPIPLAMIDLSNDRFVEANETFLRQFQQTKQAVIGATPLEIQLWANAAERTPYRARLVRDGRIQGLEARLRDRAGKVVLCQLSSVVIEDEQQKLVLFSPIDISHQRANEEKVKQMNRELESRVSQRTASLAKTNDELAATLSTLMSMQKELLRSEKWQH